MCDDGFKSTTCYDWQVACTKIAVDGRRLGSTGYTREILLGATSHTRKPLVLSFRVKSRDPPALLLLTCAITDATNHEILDGQQACYPLGFGLVD